MKVQPAAAHPRLGSTRDVIARELRSNHATAVAVAAAAALSGAFLISPRMGPDLSAQIARASFARDHPFSVVDFRWFGGTTPFSYSLWTPPVMAELGTRFTGALATVVAVGLFTHLMRRTGAHRPVWAGLAAAVTLASNLIEGRITFACGIAFGLAALVALIPPEAGGPARTRNRVAAAVFAIVAGAASPVASLFLLVAAGALLLSRRIVDAIMLALGALPLIVLSGIFGEGGHQVFNSNDFTRAALASAIVVAVVPAVHRPVRIGAAIGFVMVVLAYLLPTPVGSNATRLSLLFAIPVVVAYVPWRWWITVITVAVMVVVQSPIVFGTLTHAGQPVTRPSYFRSLEHEVAARGPITGRIEVPELTGHWDAAFLAHYYPLARGWIRQTDIELNDDVFYQHAPTATTYRGFLDRNAVQYVAVADARATYYGKRELKLVNAGLPYLDKVWSDAHWTLYAVRDSVPIISAPGHLVKYDADKIVFSAPANTEVTVRVRESRWLQLSGGGDAACLKRVDDHVVVRTGTESATYWIGSGLSDGDRC